MSPVYICFVNPDARQWAMSVIDKMIDDYGARWVKLDFNLDPAPGCNEKGTGYIIIYIGYYAFLDEIRKKYPGVVFENCASGGHRMDIEMLSHTHLTYQNFLNGAWIGLRN